MAETLQPPQDTDDAPYSVYVTTASEAEAEVIARAVLEARLVACANILGRCRSLYWWDGKIQDEGEVVVLLKTRKGQMVKLIERIKSVHSYDVPCITAWPIVDGNPDYLDWLAKESSG